MPPRVLSHDAYTIAWICALPLEMAAAKLMLEEIHGSLAQPSTDHNCYTLGSIHCHNIVIACLPSGVYGTISATTVLAQMLPTFRSLKFGLMVGIGGGVPTKADVRLGDVVVGIPSATSGGVIQYDHGKTLHSGRFERVGSSNKPPQVLLTAVSQLRSNGMVGRQFILTQAILNGLSQGQFSRPGKDLLFKPEYIHQSPDLDCSTCDQAELVRRKLRQDDEPRIHYGLIASGDQVLKDATRRDSIAQGLDILCFEMEAAGLVDQLQCLVVRGICDYCDSHKSKEWQGYAALAAAAYTKTLLQVVPVRRDESRARKGHWMVPFSRNKIFVGRDNYIATLEESVLSPGEAQKIAICGLGGIGKTQVALELAYRVRERSPEMSVFWIPCTSYESVEQAYMDIAQIAGLDLRDAAATKERVKAYLSHETSGKWLLIFDNTDDFEMCMKGTETGPALKTLLPRNEAGHILFTTRNRKLAVRLAMSNVIHISDMDKDTALQMLHQLFIRKELLEDTDATAALLRELCFLPLAISQAAAYINENDVIRLGDYLSLLTAQEGDMAKLLSEDFEDDGRYPDVKNPVTTTWLVSFHQIQLLDQLAVDYLLFLACISPRNVPQSLLPLAPSDKKRIEALGLLKSYSFVSQDPESGNLTLHRLVYLATRTWMRKNESFPAWIVKTADRMDKIFSGMTYEKRNLWQPYLPHVLSTIENHEFRAVRNRYGDLLNIIGNFLSSDGRMRQAKILYVQTLEDRQNELGKNDEQTLDSMHKVGSVLLDMGEYTEAKEMMEQVLDGQNTVLGPQHPDTLMSVATYGLVCLSQGHFTQAQSIQEQALEGLEKSLGPEHVRTLRCVETLGFILCRQGSYQEAEAQYKRAMDGYTKRFGPWDENGLRVHDQRGLALIGQGKFDEAEQICSTVLQRSEEMLGPQHPLTLNSMHHLGIVYLGQKRLEDAERLCIRTLDVSWQVLGAEHPDTLGMIDRLGILLEKQGRYEESIILHQEAIDGRYKELGEHHPATLMSLESLASAYYGQGQFEEAAKLELKVWEGKKDHLGMDHPSTLASMQNLSETYESMGKYRDAIDLTTQCLELRMNRLGAEHPETIESRDLLSELRQTDNNPLEGPPSLSNCDNQTRLATENNARPTTICEKSSSISRAPPGEKSDKSRPQIPVETRSRRRVRRRPTCA
ncbi:hypothetical protein ASPVEDRAFT_145102 [Aspergillus versicolor CBS 583.65]|uniref:Uncharacterized protein n=1 Tax=Aspergillus versicolor CBS 583.65 TaxID=1036611 RepID=A0A1L9Q537_ASPVE|nr:uncharacterized protein ASPVEDRAFT_145102 [Aspergillus versicolor CBS 583.65]OJJ08851.1 hypothetical protein ASPVEDRAFT_145102 [Aspergillus versicolor CBS 583.65]